MPGVCGRAYCVLRWFGMQDRRLGLHAFAEGIAEDFRRALMQRFDSDLARSILKEHSLPFRELMAYYRCALMEVETKFRVLNEDLSLDSEQNPIEGIESRLKSVESILEKAERKGIDLTPAAIEAGMSDIAGIRVLCSFESDVYMLANALLSQDDVQLVEKKDYIAHPKENGYRSLHLIVSVPIFLHDCRKTMEVEVQLRTLAMDVWASLEHKLLYKKDEARKTELVRRNLLECADLAAHIDRLMSEADQEITGREVPSLQASDC